MERYNDYLYPYPPPPASSSSPNRNIDTFTQQYRELTPELCPPPPPPSRPFLQNQSPLPTSSHHAHSLDPSFNHLLPFSHLPPPSDLAPRQPANYTDPRPHACDLVAPSYHTSSHPNNDSFPFLHPPASSIQPRSAPRVHQTRKRGGYYDLDDGTAHQDVKEEEEAEEANPTLYHLPHRQNDQRNPFFPDYRARPDRMPFEAGETPPAGMSTQELDNLKRVNQHARDHPFIYPLTNNLAEVEISRNEAAQRSLRGLPPRPLRIR